MMKRQFPTMSGRSIRTTSRLLAVLVVLAAPGAQNGDGRGPT
jgi:hypothetical protein